nr:MAG TPA: hypothetical protein [Caudoviricetes sp.]
MRIHYFQQSFTPLISNDLLLLLNDICKFLALYFSLFFIHLVYFMFSYFLIFGYFLFH